MRKVQSRQVAFNLGEVDPYIVNTRDDNDGIKAACSKVVNYMPLMQGALERRPGLMHADFVRHKMQAIDILGATINAPNGGTGAHILDDTNIFTTSTELGVNAAYVVAELSFDFPTTFYAIDLIDFAIKASGAGVPPPPNPPPGGWGYGGDGPPEDYNFSFASAHVETIHNGLMCAEDFAVNCVGGLSAELYGKIKIQYFSNGLWKDFGPALSIGVALRSRRFAISPNVGARANYWRIIIDGTEGGARVVQIGQVKAFEETTVLSEQSLKRFTISTDSGSYAVVVTEGNIEFYRKGIRVGSAAYAIKDARAKEVDISQTMDTILFFHKSVPLWSLMRQGTHADWDFRAAILENIPLYDFDGTNLNAINEVQQLRFANYVTGDIFNLTIEDYTSGQIVWAGTGAATAAAVKTAIEALGNIGADGITAIQGADANTIDITFTNQCGGQDWPEIVPKTIKSNIGGVVVATITQGESGGEVKISATRGYAGCGAFYSQRLWLGGLPFLPENFMASKTGDYFNFRIKGNRENSAIDVNLDTDEVTAVRRIIASRSLMIFTSSAEFFWSNEPVRADVPAAKNFTKHGISPFIVPIEIDGALMFVPKTHNDILQIVWDDQLQTYATQSVTTLGAHLVIGLSDLGFRKRANNSRPDLMVATRDDGMAVGVSMMRSENMTGIFRIETQGNFKSVCGDDAETIYFVVERFGKYRLEYFADCLMDSAIVIKVTNTPISQVAGLFHLEGQVVTIIIDGEEIGTAQVANGIVQLPYSPTNWVEVGLPFYPEIEAIPFPREGNRAGRVGKKISVSGVEIEASIFTRRFEIKGSGNRWWAMPLRSVDEVQLDKLAYEDQKTGWVGRIQGMPGHDQYGRLAIRCLAQKKHTINSLVIEATI